MWLVGNPDVTIPTAIIENGFEINGFFRNSTPQYEFPIRLSRHLMLMSRD
jgi:hypothetical protein